MRPTPAQVAAFRRDGVVLLPGVVGPEWALRMRGAVERACEDLSPTGRRLSRPAEGFTNDVFLWRRDDDFRAFALDSGVGEVAARLLGGRGATFFHDQVFVKRAGCPLPTPWHQDLPYWPTAGTLLCSLWAPLDEVTSESGGLEFVLGSHAWGARFRSVSVQSSGSPPEGAPPVPDVEGDRGRFRPVGFELGPGDVLAFHPLALHGSRGNATGRDRRAVVTRWLGDDVSYRPGPSTFPLPSGHGLRPGEAFTGPLFPRVGGTPGPRDGAVGRAGRRGSAPSGPPEGE
jgi:ectoine hydroxylase-related dioxygenase (phytanoyl-CoA dioxygenase family)